MADKYLMLDINDERSGVIAEALANKTSKKILNLLSESDMSESDLATKLDMPLNTVDYNVKKLVECGLVEETKGFFWSVKGKKVAKYRLSNKKIIISPKSSLRGVIPAVLISGVLALGVRYFYSMNDNLAGVYSAGNEIVQTGVSKVAPDMVASSGAAGVATSVAAVPQIYTDLVNYGNNGLWFFFGALVGLLVFLIWNWRKVW